MHWRQHVHTVATVDTVVAVALSSSSSCLWFNLFRDHSGGAVSATVGAVPAVHAVATVDANPNGNANAISLPRKSAANAIASANKNAKALTRALMLTGYNLPRRITLARTKSPAITGTLSVTRTLS